MRLMDGVVQFVDHDDDLMDWVVRRSATRTPARPWKSGSSPSADAPVRSVEAATSAPVSCAKRCLSWPLIASQEFSKEECFIVILISRGAVRPAVSHHHFSAPFCSIRR